MKIVFVGESESRTTPDGVVFVNGEPVDVPEDLGKSLLEQPVFELAKPKAAKPKAQPETKESR